MFIMSNERLNQQDNVNPSQPLRVEDHSHIARSTREAVASSNPMVAKQTASKDHTASIARAKELVSDMEQGSAPPPVVIPQNVITNSPPPQPPISQQPIQAPKQEQEKPAITGDLSQLVNVGRIEKSFIISGYKLVLHTLNNTENSNVLASVSSIADEAMKFNALRTSILARVIETVNGVPLENLYSGEVLNLTAGQKKEKIINTWQQTFTSVIFDKYTEMIEESAQAANGSELKN